MKRRLYLGVPLVVIGLTLGLAVRHGYGQNQNRHKEFRVPEIVAQVALKGETNQNAVTLFTPGHEGLFRLSWYLEVPPPEGASTIVFEWFDDFSQQTTLNISASTGLPHGFPPVTGISGNTGGSGALPLVIRASANQPIVYTVTSNPGTPGDLYNLFITVEQLQ